MNCCPLLFALIGCASYSASLLTTGSSHQTTTDSSGNELTFVADRIAKGATTDQHTASSTPSGQSAEVLHRTSVPGRNWSTAATGQQRGALNTASFTSAARSPAPSSSRPTPGQARGTSLQTRGPSYLSSTTAAHAAGATASSPRHSEHTATLKDPTLCPEHASVQSMSSSMTLSRSSDVLNNTNTTSTKVPNVPNESSLDNSSTSLMSNEFGTVKTDSLSTNVLASTKDASTSTSLEKPRSRRSKGAIFATVIGAAVLLMGVIVMGFWFYNVRWKLNRERSLLRNAEAPDTTPLPFSVVYYQNDGTQGLGLHRN
ncbi:uncharacterized protein LOC144114479 [Amblyomma americanum]